MTQENFPSPEKITFNIVSVDEFISSRDKLHHDLFAFLTPHTELDYKNKGF